MVYVGSNEVSSLPENWGELRRFNIICATRYFESIELIVCDLYLFKAFGEKQKMYCNAILSVKFAGTAENEIYLITFYSLFKFMLMNI